MNVFFFLVLKHSGGPNHTIGLAKVDMSKLRTGPLSEHEVEIISLVWEALVSSLSELLVVFPSSLKDRWSPAGYEASSPAAVASSEPKAPYEPHAELHQLRQQKKCLHYYFMCDI